MDSNKKYGEGRSDIVVKDYEKDRAAVFEIKYAKTLDALNDCCMQAIRQIDERAYAADLEEDYAAVTCYGASFYKKRCMVGKK